MLVQCIFLICFFTSFPYSFQGFCGSESGSGREARRVRPGKLSLNSMRLCCYKLGTKEGEDEDHGERFSSPSTRGLIFSAFGCGFSDANGTVSHQPSSDEFSPSLQVGLSSEKKEAMESLPNHCAVDAKHLYVFELENQVGGLGRQKKVPTSPSPPVTQVGLL